MREDRPRHVPVHVKAGGFVPIVAHLEDIHARNLAGTITEFNAADRVAPPSAQANLDATFTYQGASPARRAAPTSCS